jgi:serine/threonine-protein kinase
VSSEDEPLATAGIREGEILVGKYRVERVLGVGGMGVVVAAYHLHLDSRVAIKFLLPQMLANQRAVSLFANEARRAVRITSDHVARVFDVGTLENGAPYMVMEFLQGADLSALLRERGPLSLDEAVDFVLQAMEAIAEAHGLPNPIVHRDLKPANLFCIRKPDGKPHVKVLDFGISKAVTPDPGGGNLARTATGTLMGSPLYMSPEQMEGASGVDARADIWALGVILFELLTGAVPFPGETITEVSFKVASRPPLPLRQLRPDLPEEVQAVVLRCLEKDRDRRFQTVADLAMALLPLAPEESRASVRQIVNTLQRSGAPVSIPQASSTRAIQEPQRVTMEPLGRTAAGGARDGKAIVGLFGVLSALVVGGGFLAFRYAPGLRAHPDPNPPQPQLLQAASECAAGATRCSGSAQQTCAGGKWGPAAVKALQCGAACTPGESVAQCNGAMPQACDDAGQWIDRGPACPYACKSGVCVGACVPAATQCAGTNAVQTCGANADWERAIPCAPSSVCRGGACVAGPVKHGAPPPSCDPPTWTDADGHVHIKPGC